MAQTAADRVKQQSRRLIKCLFSAHEPENTVCTHTNQAANSAFLFLSAFSTLAKTSNSLPTKHLEKRIHLLGSNHPSRFSASGEPAAKSTGPGSLVCLIAAVEMTRAQAA